MYIVRDQVKGGVLRTRGGRNRDGPETLGFEHRELRRGSRSAELP